MILSVLIPTYNRESVSRKTYMLSSSTNLMEYTYAVGSQREYKWEGLERPPKCLHMPGKTYSERLSACLENSTGEFVIPMSDDDILIIKNENKLRTELENAKLSRQTLLMPSIYYSAKTKLFKCPSQIKYQLMNLLY